MDFKMKTKILRRDIAKEMLIDILDKVYGSELNHAAILSIVDSCLREIGPYLRDNDPSEQDSVTSFGSCGRNCRKRRRNNNNTKKKILTNHETNDRTVHDNGATVLRETSGGNRATSDSVRSGYVVESDNESRVRPTQGRDCPDMNSKVMSVIEGMIMDLNNFARSRVQDSEASSGYSRPCQQRSKSSRRPCVTREDRMYQVNFFDSEPCSSRVSSHDLYGKPPSEFSRGSSRWNDQYRRPVSADPINPYKKLKNDLENALRSMQTTCYDDERVSQPVLPTSAQCHDELLANITDIMTASNGMSTAASGGVTPTHRQTVVYRDVMKCPSCLSMYDGSIGSENTAIYPCKSGMKKIKYANSVASSTPTDVFTKPNNNKDLVSPSQMFLITRDIIRAVLNEPRDPQPTPCDRALEQQHALSKQGVAKAKARSQNNGDYFKQKTNFKHEVVESKDDHSIDKRVCYNTSNERARGYETHDVSADIRDHRLDFDDNNPESPGKRRETDLNFVWSESKGDKNGPTSSGKDSNEQSTRFSCNYNDTRGTATNIGCTGQDVHFITTPQKLVNPDVIYNPLDRKYIVDRRRGVCFNDVGTSMAPNERCCGGGFGFDNGRGSINNCASNRVFVDGDVQLGKLFTVPIANTVDTPVVTATQTKRRATSVPMISNQPDMTNRHARRRVTMSYPIDQTQYFQNPVLSEVPCDVREQYLSPDESTNLDVSMETQVSQPFRRTTMPVIGLMDQADIVNVTKQANRRATMPVVLFHPDDPQNMAMEDRDARRYTHPTIVGDLDQDYAQTFVVPSGYETKGSVVVESPIIPQSVSPRMMNTSNQRSLSVDAGRPDLPKLQDPQPRSLSADSGRQILAQRDQVASKETINNSNAVSVDAKCFVGVVDKNDDKKAEDLDESDEKDCNPLAIVRTDKTEQDMIDSKTPSVMSNGKNFAMELRVSVLKRGDQIASKCLKMESDFDRVEQTASTGNDR